MEERCLLPITLERVRLVRGGRTLLDDVDVELARAPVTIIVGPNGAGKTQLLRVCRGLVTSTSGRVRWGEQPPRALDVRMGFVPQHPVMLRRSTRANIDYALARAGVPRAQRPAGAREALETVGLTGSAEVGARHLSGGERQRLAIARAWCQRPTAMLLDEPAAHLDPNATRAVEETLKTIATQGTRLVMSTHDLAQAQRLAEEVVFVQGGRIAEHARAADFFDRPADPAAARFLAGELVA
jgi:tungstate transport system ATP-binding protein